MVMKIEWLNKVITVTQQRVVAKDERAK